MTALHEIWVRFEKEYDLTKLLELLKPVDDYYEITIDSESKSIVLKKKDDIDWLTYKAIKRGGKAERMFVYSLRLGGAESGWDWRLEIDLAIDDKRSLSRKWYARINGLDDFGRRSTTPRVLVEFVGAFARFMNSVEEAAQEVVKILDDLKIYSRVYEHHLTVNLINIRVHYAKYMAVLSGGMEVGFELLRRGISPEYKRWLIRYKELEEFESLLSALVLADSSLDEWGDKEW